MNVELNKNHCIVIRAIYELRIISPQFEHGDLEEKTLELRRLDGVHYPKPISRQNWTAPFADSKTGRVWAMIGQAVRRQLPHDHPIERAIRECKRADSALVADLKSQIVDLEKRVKEAERLQGQAETGLMNFKANHHAQQCADAHYRINFERVAGDNKRLAEAAEKDANTILELLGQVTMLTRRVNQMGAAMPESTAPGGAVPIKRPTFIEPVLTGNDKDLTQEDVLLSYRRAIDDALRELEGKAGKSPNPDITIVFHDFSIGVKKLYDDGKLPLRASGLDNFIFACHGLTRDIREQVFCKVAKLIPIDPVVVVIDGSKIIGSLPAMTKGNANNHEWFVTLARAKTWRKQPINPLDEGFDTTIFRRIG